ncbi:hypothetical protein CERZMDRAFT_102952 [Cercospora zeae-maydis SCOH1-5]|uniref:J domain-containing protein n=1 Tax=Cercospora zeae-maydis SCOH1-5 TaxID=717836 RepID=A0A6A6EZM3_9PEZI|nr:hypothetical protein CERZMDRAFT_102952 [Cercospora zeae-maydis SCOH1-5]
MASSSAARHFLGTARGPNLYSILQVPQDASPQAILASYHALVAKAREQGLSYDEPTDAERETKDRNLDKLGKAFQILSSPLERMRYDAAVLRRQTFRGSRSSGSHWTPSRSSRQGDSWIAARDGRDWPTPPERDENGRYIV